MIYPDLQNEVATLIATGPSFNRDWTRSAKGVVVGVNWANSFYPCDFGFACDPEDVEASADWYPEVIPILPEHRRVHRTWRPWKAIWYEACSIRDEWHDDADVLRERGSLVRAYGCPYTPLTWLRICGCTRIFLVGVDGTPALEGGSDDYVNTLKQMELYSEKWGIKMEKLTR